MEDASNEHKTWKQELASLVDYSGTMNFDHHLDGRDRFASPNLDSESPAGNVGETVKEFARGLGEMSLELARSFVDIVKQSLEDENSFITRKLGKPCDRVFGKLRFLNEYLPEDRDPVHSWSVILLVFFIALAALSVRTSPAEDFPAVKQVYIHPPSASHILLPDGIPGLKAALMEEFGIRVISYDLPGFGESDPHPQRTLESSALDISHLADALEVHDKFWLVGHSAGSLHVWAALRYIPDRLAGVAMFAPMVNPYDPSMTKDERSRVWDKWTPKRKLMYVLARRFPKLLAFFYRRSFLSGKHAPVDKWLSISLGKKDRILIEDPTFEESWQRNVEESIRQGDVKPFIEEAVLQVSSWPFKISELQAQKNQKKNDILLWLKSIYSQEEDELTGFQGPIHIWQGIDDRVVPPAVTNFVHQNLPGATIHMLPNEGNFSYFYSCDNCHRQIFTTIFGTPMGPVQGVSPELEETPSEEHMEVHESVEEKAVVGDSNEHTETQT